MLPWVECETLDVDIDLPVRRRFEAHRARVEKPARELLWAIRQEMPSWAKYGGYLVNVRTYGRYWREARAAAQIVDADWREVMAAALSYEFVVGIFACSTVALATQEGPVLARNMDFWPEQALARASYLIRNVRQGDVKTMFAGWPGALGAVTGLSTRGFAVALNAVSSSEGVCRTGYPVLLFLREVMENARDYGDAVRMLSTQRLMVSALFTLVGRANDERAVVERTPRRAAIRKSESDEPLLATNGFRKLVDDSVDIGHGLTVTSCGRYDSLEENCTKDAFIKDQPSDEALLFALTDERVQQNITAQHVIMRPYRNELRVFVPRHLLESAGTSD